MLLSRKNHEKRRSCQAPCQHTTCQACYFKTKDEPPCRKCSTNDFDCLKKFGKCVKRELCTRAKYPCMAKAKVCVMISWYFFTNSMFLSHVLEGTGQDHTIECGNLAASKVFGYCPLTHLKQGLRFRINIHCYFAF